MAKGFKHGAGGGASLNFKVVGGASAPSNPKENTIWVDTDTEITGWQFASDDPNLVKFKEWIDGSYIVNGSKTISGNSVTLVASGENCYTQYNGDTAPEVSCIPGKTYIYEWTHSGSPGRVYIFPNKSTDGMVYVDASVGRIEYTVPDGVYMFSFRIGVQTTGTSATYSNIRITEKERSFAPGAVWIQTGKSSTAPFNALKKNNITVYPISAKQYVGGAWVDKTAQIYKNGAWVDWITYMYDKGNQFTDLTGGWASYGDCADVKFESGYILLQLKSGYNEQTAAAHTANKIDVTGISTLYFYIDERTSDDIADSSKISKYAAVGISDSPDIINNGWVAYTQVLKTSVGTLYTVDVSQYSGEYYVCVHNAINGSGYMKCSAVYGK